MIARPVRALSVLLLAVLGAWSCAEDDFVDDRPRMQAGSGQFDAASGIDAEMSLCTASPPKVGENCPSSEESQLRCTFAIGVCEWEGSTYDITVDYCCQRGVGWSNCGTNVTPCDREVDAGPATTESDANANADAGSDL